MEKLIERAEILLEALPYIRKFYGKTIVIKYGGNAMVNDELKRLFAKDIVLLKYIGMNPVIVHGGGPQIGELLKKLGIESRFFGGLRVTDKETVKIVEMVLVGRVNKEIVSLINGEGGQAVGVSGKDGSLLKARKINMREFFGKEPPQDLGYVGEIEEVNEKVIKDLASSGFIPVIAPVAYGTDGETYNVNADTAAGEIAGALKAEKLIILTDTEGIKDKNGNVIKTLSASEIPSLIEKEVIKAGMIPKVRACLSALSRGVKKAHIIDGRIKHSLLLEIFTKEGIGTEIV